MKKAIIIGATSGIGREVARLLANEGWQLGIAGRREEMLQSLQTEYPDGQVKYTTLDVTNTDATTRLQNLIDELGGMDLYFHSSGMGSQNIALDPELEIRTARTNGEGFVRMITFAFNYFKTHATKDKHGHISIISSIAGTKGIGVAPAYSATKRFQNTYLQALVQLAHIQKLPIHFTDIRPGFVATDFLRDAHYPLLMQTEPVARDIVQAIKHRRRIRIIDWRFRILVFFWKLIPRPIWEHLRIKKG
jgi:short-subunit dehydrogenase